VATPAAPWLDNSWHHVAFTADSSKKLRLYLDGVQYGSTITYSGTLHTPNAPIYLGSTQGYASNNFTGQLDDFQFSAGAPDAADVAGYAATQRPHAQSIWQSSGYAGTQGAALSGNCSNGSRCADTIYGGPSLQREGARYYATHQLRTTAGLWSAPVTDWFETRDGIALSAPATVALGSVPGGATATGSFAATTTCTNGTGCQLLLSTASDTIALHDATYANSIPPNTVGSPATWATGGASGFGCTVLSSTNGKDTAKWGTGVNFSNLGLLKFTGGGTAGTVLKQTSSSGVEVTTVGIRADSGLATPAAYSGTITLLAIDAP
jgi:hypothetical protein